MIHLPYRKNMKLKFKRLHPNASTPVKAYNSDAGFDLTCVSITHHIQNDEYIITYHTGIAVLIPKGYYGQLCSRSSIKSKDLFLSNGVGIIDSGYTGEIMANFRKTKPIDNFIYTIGDKICQLIILPLPDVELEEVKTFEETERGDNGFGSSGK